MVGLLKDYPNIFAEIGISNADVDVKIKKTFETMFFDSNEKIYFEFEDDMGYMVDTGNNDVRTEGMSYGMMMALQMDYKDIFDRLWLFSKRFMFQKTGVYQGYFAWSVSTEGVKNSEGPASDGEEYFAMALFFAASRWGDQEEPFNYSEQAKDILKHCIHQDELVKDGKTMWNRDNHYIKFVPETEFTDPSYHLPHFYELFAQKSNKEDREFWKKAAQESRKFIIMSCHKETGMAPEYALYNGKPKSLFRKCEFYSDSYRVAMNIGLDGLWFEKNEVYCEIIDRLQGFFFDKIDTNNYKAYMIDGTELNEEAMHPVAIIATNAAGSLATNSKQRLKWIDEFWNTPLRKGKRRYYDNCLYFFCLLMLAGEYRMY